MLLPVTALYAAILTLILMALAINDIGFSLKKRNGFLLGFHAILANKSVPLP